MTALHIGRIVAAVVTVLAVTAAIANLIAGNPAAAGSATTIAILAAAATLILNRQIKAHA